MNVKKVSFLLLTFLLNIQSGYSQKVPFYHNYQIQQKLFDLTYCELRLKFDPDDAFIEGSNRLQIKVLEDIDLVVIDLADTFLVKSVQLNNHRTEFIHQDHKILISTEKTLRKDSIYQVLVVYEGHPPVASNPPWLGGMIWKKTPTGYNWISVACQGIGPYIWWPAKNDLSDEPDSMDLYFTVPDELTAVGNGILQNTIQLDNGWRQFYWRINYPINNYNVTVNAAPYALIEDHYLSSKKKDSLKLSYYVLPDHERKAQQHFRQVKPMLEIFEKLYGVFPFWKDGYKLVEVPYWGMEHQTAIAYGNQYQNNEFNFDFIILHESAHEYWGNAVSGASPNDLWIHEAFATYSEALYVEHTSGYRRYLDYLQSQKHLINNQSPMVSETGDIFREWEDTDIYYKGSWMLHSLRHSIGNDEKWFKLLKDFQSNYQYKIINTRTAIEFFDKRTNLDLEPFFRQFLYEIHPPRLQYRLVTDNKKHYLEYRWLSNHQDFNMPVVLELGNKEIRLFPEFKTKKIEIGNKSFQWRNDLFYFDLEELP